MLPLRCSCTFPTWLSIRPTLTRPCKRQLKQSTSSVTSTTCSGGDTQVSFPVAFLSPVLITWFVKTLASSLFTAMVYELDQTVGHLVRDLKAKGMLENSIILFSTDNGGAAAGFNQNAASNWPMKGARPLVVINLILPFSF